ncbi:MAG TPA: hypothetical protein PLP73_00235 [Candidatus Absconditabacterales bacterium]|nr:hypothetical protein [Candidatus Absconditabacterales bacterium]HRU50495.1 hypothetical protein [Candidatus Absconditabacterales bacterium]
MRKQIVLGLLFMAIGALLIYYSAQLVDLLGRIPRAEKNLGGTRNAIILFGFAIIVLGVLYMFGVLNMGSPLKSESVGAF